MKHPERPRRTGAPVDPTASTVIALLSVLQILGLGAAGLGVHIVMAVLLGIAAVTAIVARSTALRHVPAIVGIGLAANLIGYIAFTPTPFPARLALLAVAFAHVAALAGFALRLAFGWRLLPVSTAVALLLTPLLSVEALLAGNAPLSVGGPLPGSGTVAPPAPDSGGRYAPNSTAVTRYSSDLGGYLDSLENTAAAWSLRVIDSLAAAHLELARDGRSGARVVLDSTTSSAPWGVQLVKAPLQVSAGREYVVSFSARADTARTAWLALALGRPPWTSNGLGVQAGIDTIWRSYSYRFQASHTDPDARLFAELGNSPIPVELASLVLRDVENGLRIEPADAGGFLLPYRFNSLGCRGPEPLPSSDTTLVRILALGDSYTLGAGVKEGDTWSARLQRWLNDRSRSERLLSSFEVLNCGAAGQGIAQSREVLSEVVSRYRPDVVLLALGPGNSNLTGAYDVARPRGRLEWLMASLWTLRQRGERTGAGTDLTPIATRVVELGKTARDLGARLAVVILQSDADPRWSRLDSTLAERLADADVPQFNVGSRVLVFADSNRRVHPVLDRHPSHLIHRTIAESLGPFLVRGILQDAQAVSPVDPAAKSRVPGPR